MTAAGTGAADAPPAWARLGPGWPNAEASRFLRAGGVAWHVQRMGPVGAPPILLLHGAGGASHSWRDVMPLLAAEADVIAPDLPQHGFSRAPAGGRQSMPAMARALGALLAALDARPALIVGHSAGAAVALRMVLDGHAAPGAVIGFNAALAPFRGLAGLLFPPTAKFLALNPASPWVFSSVVGGRQQARRLIEGTGSTIDRRGLDCYRALFGRSDHVSGALTMMANWDLRPLRADLWRLETPTLLVVGLGDRAVPPDEARRLAAAHEEIRYAEAAGAGHLLHEERPGEAAATILDVLRGREVGEVPGAG